ncbi:phosphonate ABC transporter, permease protein PhnE [Rhizobiaceae bacterium n13]|uniref:Phosphonate ABC transporter, permease protein PhnE n=1 Tax=Ferirhizobium litorale TaxID=2927786 RepID=A0AAE3QIE6_9HYPH|nr:phosphonate ABC transporter, permease protein PhnE [Fererhizobium litorale]MDI7862890.1 phosphonate ABC transporter, permease protein PhnE [Fererhizobium litorale]MDI7923976.1 phosphonate ABC transporter, permease protein PhnE [Fererhizobium litorale]
MTVLDRAELDRIASRHPEIFRRSAWQRFRIPAVVGATLLYFVFCWWFFAIGQVLGSANWPIAGMYLADWVSYESRPIVKVGDDGTMTISFPRYDPLGPNPDPDWLIAERKTVTRTVTIPVAVAPQVEPAKKSTMSFMTQPATVESSAGAPAATTVTKTEEVVSEATINLSSTSRIDLRPDQALLTRNGETLAVRLGNADGIVIDGPLPDWASQRRPGEKIVASFGLAGWAEVEPDAVKIRKRFLGWANFLFDTNSPFFGKSTAEVASLIVTGERIDPSRSNLSLAWNNILYNAEWQHLDVWTKLLQTIVMAFVGTLFAMLVAFPLSFIAARNITRNRPVNQIAKRFFDFLRSVDMFIWALFFTRAFGPGPLAGISAIFFTDTGTLGKLYSEALENIDDKQREGVKSVGASPAAVQRFGVMPQVMPLFASQALYFWESNTRSATIIGAVGAGGIGLKLWEAMRTNADWENVAYMVLLILIVVFVFDAVSNALRSRLMGTGSGR